MSVQVMIQLACGVAVIPMVLWFYPHCARPSLAHAHARPAAFLITQLGTVAGVVIGVTYIADALGFLPRSAAVVGLVLMAAWAPAALAYLRPMWVVRATGGPTNA